MASTELSVMLTAKGNLETELRTARDRVKQLDQEIKKANASGDRVSDALADEYRQTTREVKKLSDEVSRTNRNVRAAAAQSTTAMGKLGRAVVKHQTAIRNAGLIAMGALTLLVKSSISAASDLVESQSKIGEVFRESAGEVEQWAENAAVAFGQSKQQALEAAGTYGNLFQAFGLARGEAAEMSMTMTQLAADLASFNNTSIDDAITALRSGLSGQTEPLKRYGIVLNDVRLRHEALRQGIIRSTKDAVTPAIRAQAAYGLIMSDTALAQGDFARTSGDLANSQRIAAAEFTNAKAALGEDLLPIVRDATKLLTKFTQGFASLPSPVRNVTLAVAALGAAAMIATPKIIALNTALAARGGIAGLGIIGRNAGAAARGLAAVTVAMVALRAIADEQGNVYTTKNFYANRAEPLADALRDLIQPGWFGTFQNVVAGVTDVLVPHNTALDDAREQLAAFDKQLVNLVIQGKVHEAEVRFNGLAASAASFGASADEVRGRLPGYAAALDEAKQASENLASATGEATEQVNGLMEAMKAFMGVASQQQALRAWRQSVKAAIAEPSAEAAYASIAAFDKAFASFEEGSDEQARFVARNYDKMTRVIESSGLKKKQQDQLLAPLQAARDEAQKVVDKLSQIDGTSVSVRISYFGGTPTNPGGYLNRARGGLVAGPGTSTSDSIPAMLSNGEFVLRAAAVRAIGAHNVKALNRADKMTDPALLPRLATRDSTQQLSEAGASGPLIGAIHVHNPARDVDVEAAVTRGLAKVRRIERERGGRG